MKQVEAVKTKEQRHQVEAHLLHAGQVASSNATSTTVIWNLNSRNGREG